MQVLTLFKKGYVLLLYLYGLFSVSVIHAQNPVIDSLKNAIRTSTDDTSKVWLYYEYGEQLETSNPDTALAYYTLAREKSVQLNFLKGRAAFASHAIVILNNQGKFREALELCKEALLLYQEIGTKKDLSVAYLNVGSAWHYLSDFELATKNYFEAKKLAEEIDDKRLQRITNNNLASIFINLQDYQKGKEYAEKSLALAIELKNDYAISSSTFNIATAELYLKHYDKALMHYTNIEGVGIRIDDYTIILDGWLGKADVYNAMANAMQAEKYYKKVISFSKEKNAPEYEMYAYMGLSDLYIATNQNRDAEQNIQYGIALAQKLGSNYELKDLYLKASTQEEKTGNFSKALDFRKKYEILNDSIVGEKSKTNINLQEIRFESEKKESKINQLEAEKKSQELSIRQKNMLNYILIGSAITLVIIFLLVYRTYQQKQKLHQQRISELETEKQLTAAEAVLKGEEQERTRLAKDLHDGLGGMLSGIKYSFNTMKENLIMTPDNQQAFERSMDMLDSSIQEMRRVAHNMMPEVLVRFGLAEALKSYCDNVRESRVYKIDFQSIGLLDRLSSNTEIFIYRIVQELLNNIARHAKATQALVQIAHQATEINITVEDNGIGMNQDSLVNSTGTGWANIRSRVEYLKGKADVQSASGQGTSVHITIPVS